MPSPEIIERFLRGEELPLAVDHIAAELEQLWQALPAERMPTRDYHLNLLVQMSNPALIDQTTATLREFAQIHPCRVLLLVLNLHSEQEELSASVTALLAQKEGGQVARCEQIMLLASGGVSVARAVALALPLVSAELPVAYWFVQGIPAETPLLTRLRNQMPRLMFDSFMTEDLGITLARAHTLFESTPQLGDLNWQRLAPWRAILEEALAKPECKHLEKISFILGGEILDENHIGQPVLLMSWLAQRLEWELVETLDYVRGTFRAVWEKDGREIVAEIKNTNTQAQELNALELTTDFAGQQTVLTFARVDSGTSSALQIVLAHETCKQDLPALEMHELLRQEFERKTDAKYYQETLELATKLI